MKNELTVWSPLWLEYSGLPQLLAEKVKGSAGWPAFKKIVELDCASNSEPGTVEISLEDLAAKLGLAAGAVRKSILSMRKLKLLACFLPESDEEAALLKLRTPLLTPVSPSKLKKELPHLFSETHYFRYYDDYRADEDADESADPVLQEIVDLYFNAVGLKMNAFVLDELRLLRHRFPIEQVRRTFRRAQQNEIRSLHWILRELVRQKTKYDAENSNSPG